MNLASVIGEDADDLYRIEVDIPNSPSKAWNFVYICNFEVNFKMDLMCLSPRGRMFPNISGLSGLKEGCSKEKDINAYKFEEKPSIELWNLQPLPVKEVC
ncbi:MAG: hypothetical protein V8Q42_09865 [Anaerovoracaceae bacterium]